MLGAKTVNALQRFLKANGHPNMRPDGIYGPETRSAFERAKAQGLLSGSPTTQRPATPSPSPSPSTPRPGAGGDDAILADAGFANVMELQQFLLSKNIDVGKADGIMGPRTRGGYQRAKAQGLFNRPATAPAPAPAPEPQPTRVPGTVYHPGPFPIARHPSQVARPAQAQQLPPAPVAEDIVMGLVFPDYAITVNSVQTLRDNIPDAIEEDVIKFLELLPGVDISPSGSIKSGRLGHAAVAFTNGRTGHTRYWEYGRYDRAQRGICRNISVPDLKMTPDFEVDPDSLNRMLARVSQTSGGGTRVSGVFCRVALGSASKLERYCQRVHEATSSASNDPYSPMWNSCLHFMVRGMREAGVRMPSVIDPRPRAYIQTLQSRFPPLHWPDQQQRGV